MSALGRRVFAAGVMSLSLVACSAIWGFEDLRLAPATGDAGSDYDADGGERPNPDAVGNTKARKVDLLFVIDNTAAMAPKILALTRGLESLLRVATSTNDVRVGVVSSSLGGVGGDLCNEERANDHARLINGRHIDYAAATNFDTFYLSVERYIAEAGTQGCGFPSPLESLYRFLSAPDPWESVKVVEGKASYSGVDETVLAQRAQFLRPDSLVVVLMLTDRDDAGLDPLSFSGLGWAFSSENFPGSTVKRSNNTTTAPRGTSVCQTNPGDPGCTSCICIDEPCPAVVANDPACLLNGGYQAPTEDWLTARAHKMKQRYGRDPQYGVGRYVNALTKVRVPRRSEEHPETTVDGKRRIADYDAKAATCTNPLFAAKLPSSSSEEWCDLPVGPRDKNLVLFGVIGGVTPSLIGADGAPLSWTSVLGSDPAGYSDSGKDKHMIASMAPRDGLAAPSATRGDPGPDPEHGREYDTQNFDLQYACTVAIEPPVVCDVSNQLSCDCGRYNNPPLCDPTAISTQIKTKAYPSLRQLRVARDLGDRAVVGSVCRTATETYKATLDVLGSRMSARLLTE